MSALSPLDDAADRLLRGVDASHWQGEVDWQVAALSGACEFAYLKATDGSLIEPDDTFAANWSGTLSAGVPRGAYHFLVAGVPGDVQAEQFLRAYPGDGELPPALDLEWDLHGNKPSAEVAADWLCVVHGGTGVRPIVYTSPAFAAIQLAGPLGIEIAAVHELWVAHYGVRSPRVPEGWKTWRIWQTRAGYVPGFKWKVDVDLMKPIL